jgi:OOP family OmpA-OmpF porin
MFDSPFRRLAALLVAAALMIAPPVFADPPATLTLGGTYNVFDDDREVDDEAIPFGALEFRFTERWAGEFWISDGDTDSDLGFDADITRWHLDALYYLSPRGDLHPYLAGGAGQLYRDWDVPNGNLDDSDEELNFGGGVHWFFTDNFSLRGDARYLFGPDDSTSDFTVSVGIAYRFGGEPSRPAPAPAPEPEPEPEPLDSDGDGVIDDNDACPGTPAGRTVDERGCEPRFVAGESVELQVNFAFNSDEVDTNYLDDIQELADFMKRHPEVVAEIEAHTDSMGPESYNQALSQRRAESVIRVLTDRFGIPGERLIARGYGESRPIADNGTEEGRAANRRVAASLAIEGRME